MLFSRFSLRVLFAVLTFACVAMAAIVCPLQSYRQERAVLAELPVTATVVYLDRNGDPGFDLAVFL